MSIDSYLGAKAFENLQFRGDMGAAINAIGPSLGATRVRAALDSVDPNTLSTQEKNILASLASTLGADGHISMADADFLVGTLQQYSDSGQFVDTLLGGNSGLYTGGGSSLPFTAAALMSYPGSIMFAATMGYFVDAIVQTFQDAMFLGSADAMLDQCVSMGGCQTVRDALGDADLSKLNAGERARVLSMIGFAGANGYLSRAEGRAIRDYINQCQGLGATPAPGWQVQDQGNGRAHIELSDRYSLDLNERSSEFILINKETGERTRIWGDPHFDQDGRRVGDFYGTLSLNLDDGTKVTIDTVPWEAGGNGATLSSQLTITNGDRAIVVTGLDQNRLGDLNIVQSENAGVALDAFTDDGVNIYENPEGAGWLRTTENGWFTPVDGQFLSSIR